MNLLTIFATGLFTGGLTCLAVQGGLLASTLAQREEARLKENTAQTGNALPIIVFLLAKIVAYTIFGFLLGWLGSFFQLSLSAKVIMQFVVAIFMIGTALNLLQIHPLFRYFAIQPPRALTRLVRNQSKSNDVFAPFLLGAFTVFIPCGTTQAMMALAIASGNPVLGATILFVFILGTSPIFFLLGYFTTKMHDVLHDKFIKVAALAIILLAIYNLDGATALTGSNLTLANMGQKVWCTVSFCDGKVLAGNGETAGVAVDNPTIYIQETGYNPNNLTVQAGSEITLQLINNGGRGCTQSFNIPELGIQTVVPFGQSDTVKFKAPGEKGPLAFMCGMGMFRGTMYVN